MLKKNFNIIMTDVDRLIDPFSNILNSVIALSNSGGGVIFLEGETLENKNIKANLTEYIAENTIPQVYPLIDILFPPTNWKIHVYPSNGPVSSATGDVYGLDSNLLPCRRFTPNLKINRNNPLFTYFREDIEDALDTEKIQKLTRTISAEEKFKNLDQFPTEVFYKMTGAIRIVDSERFPTAAGLLLAGKEDAISRLLPKAGIIYTLYDSKRQIMRKKEFFGKTVFKQRDALFYEIIRDSKCCRESKAFPFVFSHSLFVAFSLYCLSKDAPINVRNKNGLIEILFQSDPKEKNAIDKISPLKTDFGQILSVIGKSFFKKNSSKIAADLMRKEGLPQIKITRGTSVGTVTADFKHKKTESR